MFRGNMGGGMNMQNLMRQAQKMQEEMQKKMAENEETLESTTLTGTVAGGMVEVSVNGKKKVQSISIKPEAVDPEDVEMLEDMIVAALNDAMDKATALEEKLKADMPVGL